MAYKGRRAEKRESPRRRSARPWITACLLLLLLSGSIMGTIAYMQAHSHLGNTFTVAKLTLAVDETFANNVKSDVTIKNTGDVPAYLRAAVVVCWKDDSGNILSDAPADTDYTIAMGSGWTQGGDGYWYCAAPVAAGGASPTLIASCKPTRAVDGKHLCVDILVQGVQAEPTSAVQELWGVTVDDGGALTPPTAEGGETP